ncbi:hypothetical protein [Perlabentimonas gracilis]|uniref:hypothetical protein n=1 Tax=Perlabentimonas gracilis TaxID=2715279 RepID=UPI00140BF57C|nr:hypothetical protein [Perlabentimonas gracilis]NHB67321.1 hypothetical protein [Perlabentimonas gracilis]
MEAKYNFILADLLWSFDAKEIPTNLLRGFDYNEFIDGFTEEMIRKGATLDVDFLCHNKFSTKRYAKLKKLLNKCLDARSLKLQCVKNQDFEGASSHRNKERELLSQIENEGFGLSFTQQNEYALYHVDVDTKNRNVRFTVYSNGSECETFLLDIAKRVAECTGKKMGDSSSQLPTT